MKKYILTTFVALAGTALFQGCLKPNTQVTGGRAPVLPASPHRYSAAVLPEHLGGQWNSDLLNSQINDEVATLGRVLFYDKRLSLNNTIACASCHKQSAAFSDDRQYSVGFEGKSTIRNSMTIINPVFNPTLFWDSRANGTRDLVLKPVQNHIEMGMESFTMLEKKLGNTTFYPALFEKAFGSKSISTEKIADALTQFLNSMITANSKYDQGKPTQFANFTAQEKLGYDVFTSEKAKCSSCHAEPTFSVASNDKFASFPPNGGGMGGNPYQQTLNTTNIGLDRVYADPGHGDGRFRIPSLRNIELTAPYMHDGRFQNLKDVVNHYNNNIQAHEKLDVKFRGSDGNPIRLGLTDSEVDGLIAFLKTLTDKSLIEDDKFSDPFPKE